LGQRLDKDDYFVECVRCGVYQASRKAFRHFEYLRWRGDPAGIARLERLAQRLHTRTDNEMVRLDYDTWQSVAEAHPERS
jgi:hypothetical protein